MKLQRQRAQNLQNALFQKKNSPKIFRDQCETSLEQRTPPVKQLLGSNRTNKKKLTYKIEMFCLFLKNQL